MPWYAIVLIAMKNEGEISLPDIYVNVEEVFVAGGVVFFKPWLLEPDPKRGNRPRYQHSVQATAGQLVEKGLAERPARGYYRITSQGQDWLKDYEGS